MSLAYALISIGIVSAVSLVGAVAIVLSADRLKKWLTHLVSFSAGALLGDAFIHILPEAVGQKGFSISVSLMILFGIVSSFALEKIIHWRHCHIPQSHDHVHAYAKMNIIGDAVHNFLDGMIITASFLVSIPLGVATTIAVVFHEIPQEIGDFGILLHGGYSPRRALWFNFLTALSSFAGFAVVLIGGIAIFDFHYYLVSFAAGGFIYIAAADLIPEMHKEIGLGKALVQISIFCLGILIMLALR